MRQLIKCFFFFLSFLSVVYLYIVVHIYSFYYLPFYYIHILFLFFFLNFFFFLNNCEKRRTIIMVLFCCACIKKKKRCHLKETIDFLFYFSKDILLKFQKFYRFLLTFYSNFHCFILCLRYYNSDQNIYVRKEWYFKTQNIEEKKKNKKFKE